MRSLSVAARPMACAANSTPLLVLILPAASRRLCTAHAASFAALCVLFRNPAVNVARRLLRISEVITIDDSLVVHGAC